MKHEKIGYVAVCAAVAVFLSACAQGNSPDTTSNLPLGSIPETPKNATRTITGTITVPDSSYWVNLKMGVFSDGADWMSFSSENLNAGEMRYSRFCYDSDSPSLDVSFTPVTGATYVITGTGTTERAFSFTLPSEVAAASVSYYLVAWQDSNANGTLDIKNASAFMNPATVAQGEFNRLGWKMHLNVKDTANVEMVSSRFSADKFYNKPDIWMLYLFEDIDYYNVYEYLTTDNASGFSFSMIPQTKDTVTGW